MARPHQFTVSLTEGERQRLERGCQFGNWGPRKVQRAKILLLADSTNNTNMQK